jgi:hypothetical protein
MVAFRRLAYRGRAATPMPLRAAECKPRQPWSPARTMAERQLPGETCLLSPIEAPRYE